jgi:translation initiation factor 1
MKKDRLVWSSESGRICPECSKPVSACICKKKKKSEEKKPARNYPADGVIRIMRETKGHKGKTVTVIGNIPLNDNELKEFAKKLKARCGTGGSIRGGEILIQGDHRQVILDEITRQGHRVKLAGG